MGVADIQSAHGTETAEPIAQTPIYRHLDAPEQPASAAAHDPVSAGIRTPDQPSWFDKLEAFISRLSVRDNFWNSVCSLIWLPLAFFSGIRMKELERRLLRRPGDPAVPPIQPQLVPRDGRRGAAGQQRNRRRGVRLRHLRRRLHRRLQEPELHVPPPLLRPGRLPHDAARGRQGARRRRRGVQHHASTWKSASRASSGERDRRVGKCEATFHVTPKVHHKRKKHAPRRR